MSQVGILPAAPLPAGVKVARRPVKPFGVGASPTLAANLRKAGRYKLAAPVSKTGSVTTEVGALPTPSAIYQTQLLFRKSYKPNRVIRIRPTARLNLVFRPVNRFGAKPRLAIVS